MNAENKYDIVVPICEKDIDVFFHGIKWLYEFLPVKKIVLIGNNSVKGKIPDRYKDLIEYIDEDSIIPYDDVKAVMKEVSGNDPDSIKRTGWYLQQFLKMKYADICTDEYYIVWDADTYSIRKTDFFDKNHPIFDVRQEYHENVFNTMRRILPELSKIKPFSFIAEHMLISCKIMKEMINEIEQNECVGKQRDLFYKKILWAIDKNMLAQGGFSEFETYGTYCVTKYPDLYVTREWNSLRHAAHYFDRDKFSDYEVRWLNKSYDAVSFELWSGTGNILKKVFRNRMIQKRIGFEELVKKTKKADDLITERNQVGLLKTIGNETKRMFSK